MSETIESRGRTVEEAISEALLRLGLRRDEVDVTVLQQPKGGFLGLIGGKPAVVRVEKKSGAGRGGRGRRDGARRGGYDDRRQTSDRRDEGRADGRGGRGGRGGRTDEGPRRGGGAAATTDQTATGARGGRGERGRGNRRDRDGAPSEPSAAATVDAGHGSESAVDGGQSSRRRRRRPRRREDDRRDGEARGGEGRERSRRENDDRRAGEPREDDAVATPAITVDATAPAAENPTLHEPEVPVAAVSPEMLAVPTAAEPLAAPLPSPPPTEPVERTLQQAGARVAPYAQADAQEVPAFLQRVTTDLMRHAGFPCRCEVREDEYAQVKLITDDRSAGVLIGRHGASVDAIEMLVERIASHTVGDRVKMNLDINNYRRRREEQLVQMTRSVIREVRETGQPVHLDPMGARERRIVHLQVQETGNLVTYTVAGTGGKHVVVAPSTYEFVAEGAVRHGDVDEDHDGETDSPNSAPDHDATDLD